MLLLTPLSNFHSIICQVVIDERLRTKENFKLLGLKVVAVAFKRWSLYKRFKMWCLHYDLETFGISENWLLRRDGH